eukprot:scaffold18085_cov45-Attheya_sp.AAC.3
MHAIAYAGMRCQLIIVQAHNPSISFADRGKINKDQKCGILNPQGMTQNAVVDQTTIEAIR